MKETKTRRETQPYGIRPAGVLERTPRPPPAPIAGAWRGLAGFLAVAGSPGAPKRKRDGEQKVQTPSPDRGILWDTDSPVS